jgi:hypothetical protein
MIANPSAIWVWWFFARVTNQNWHNKGLLATMDFALFDLAHNLDLFLRMGVQLNKKTDPRDERLIRAIVVFALTVIRSDFDA